MEETRKHGGPQTIEITRWRWGWFEKDVSYCFNKKS